MIMEKLGIALTDWESYSEDSFDTIIWKNGAKCTKEEWNKAKAELQAEYDAQAYARNRQAEYPDWGSQLNKIFDDGLTKWKSEMVQPVKDKWPKDNSGPK
tara:strand:- start:1420 stop:1719 length:300 start_codon:yes stop_codon:yes gene_type:complete